MAWLLDTNVVSELKRPRPDARVVKFLEATPLHQLFISVVTLAEIRFGISLLPDADRRAGLESWLTREVRPQFEGRVLPISEEIILRWRILIAEGRKSGHTFSQPDLFTAATAAHYELTVVTRDRSNFDKAHVPVLNPWEAT